ncbi:retrovirus-related Pol polyprotein from transposon TNT 1-94 isoform X1 [Vigna angularis]|uniref:retrovirus-related Pol polyprotein from transposon TNT 1-94 isoform X1 n=1 Tax=Phaseolus angularis TaxID=3914 RepID=UPI0022B3DC4B|nr:retrovirus-related Pol polyprotein from transposon TNT 1-94 isoform X1 [Vigna angularis]XP_052730973.1 retrovirus-related Pol polyprotein from transposon TNT 1-94 isoform X1 [Vigna angularis]XP_052730974.1 retrovirus-related Pol polyprotein from transposon TNT 1-94 isoform X1 [Vigna angularis]
MFPHLYENLDISKLHCETCELAKHTRAFFPNSNNRSSQPFQLIHSDIWGPSTVPNISGARWFVTFIDDCTRVTWLYLLKQKSDVSTIIPIFHSMIRTQFGVNIKRFRTDNARDYFNQTISSYFQSNGIIHDSSCVYTPQQNGVAERKNGHLLNITRALLFQGNVPKKYWGEAVLTASYLINRLPSHGVSNKSPIEVLNNFFPHFKKSNGLIPRIFGCTAFAHVPVQARDKLDPRAVKCIFLGYSATQKGYKCYDPIIKRWYISADVTFLETKPFFNKTNPTEQCLEDPHENAEFLTLPYITTNRSEPPTIQHNYERGSEAMDTDFPIEATRIEADNPPRFNKVYTRRKQIPEMMQVHESNPSSAPGNEEIREPENEIDLPIALRKGHNCYS